MAVCCGLARCAWLCACFALVSSADVAAATLCRFGASGACDRSVAVAVQAENCESEALYALCSSAELMKSLAGGLGQCYCGGGLPRRCSDLCYALTSGHGGLSRDDTACSSVCPDYVTQGHVAQANGDVYGSKSSGDGGGIGSKCSTLLYLVVVIAAVVVASLLAVVAILFTATSRCGTRCLGEAFSKPRVRSEKTWSASDVRGAPKKPSGNSLGRYVKAQNINESAEAAHKKAAADAVTVTALPPLLAQLTTKK